MEHSGGADAAAACTVVTTTGVAAWSELNLYNWPGTKGGWNYMGAYSSGGSPDGTATAVGATGAVANVNYWKSGFFCVKRLAAATAGSTKTDFKATAGAACQQYQR